MKTTLVTGGLGFIGTNLCKTLLDKGYTVIAVDNIITSTKANLSLLSKNPRFFFIQHDITQPFLPDIQKILSSVSSIFHLACPTGVPNITPLAEEMLLTCSFGTRNVLELAKKNKAKILFTSSSEVYGNPTVFPQNETYTGNVQATGPRSPYEEGKRFAESLITMYVKKYNIDAKIVRIFNTYGPYMSQADTRVIPKFIQQIKTHKPLTIEGDGSQKRTFCYIDDLIKGLFLILEKGKKGEIYNLGNDQIITIKELALLISSLSHQLPHIKFIQRPNHDHDGRLPLLTKVKQLGWTPSISLQVGLQKTIQWYGF